MTLELDEDARRRLALRAVLNAMGEAGIDRTELIECVGEVWDTSELQRDFEVLSFLAPFVLVRRRSDGARGTVVFIHAPRFYFGFVKDVR